ncbi:uncharacterized protein LAJ45_02934 [Morchella importuna]|uniref:uncharacterized protein n=1 Tax=Morchella importuna TaxID=1174673 RepID=UPI001E8E9C69|nr:uncharacterized protein LAJ45_02934 [Morchella importuna]KAH8152710.1 hypothetical protein LAJ45_02934 [Morchella importuna]
MWEGRSEVRREEEGAASTSTTDAFTSYYATARTPPPPPQTRNTDKRRSTAPFIKETRKDRCPARTWPRHRFTTSQVSLHNPQKWCLPGGRNYENIHYVHFCNKQTECAAHSWVVHLHNPDVGVLFDDAGWDVIIPPCKEFGRCHPRDGSRSALSAHPYLGFAHTIPRAAGNLGGGRVLVPGRYVSGFRGRGELRAFDERQDDNKTEVRSFQQRGCAVARWVVNYPIRRRRAINTSRLSF